MELSVKMISFKIKLLNPRTDQKLRISLCKEHIQLYKNKRYCDLVDASECMYSHDGVVEYDKERKCMK